MLYLLCPLPITPQNQPAAPHGQLISKSLQLFPTTAPPALPRHCPLQLTRASLLLTRDSLQLTRDSLQLTRAFLLLARNTLQRSQKPLPTRLGAYAAR